MSPAGWVIMLVSNVFVICLITWCFYRVLTLPPLEPGEQL